MVGTRRAALLALVGVAVIVVAPDPRLAFALVDAAILLAMLADVALSAQLKNLQVARSGDRATRLGEPARVTVTVRNSGSRRLRGALRDAWPPSAGARGNVHRVTIPAREQRTVASSLVPSRRGVRRAAVVTVRAIGPLGLAGRQRRFPAPWEVQVLPLFRSRRLLAAKLARLRQVEGLIAVRGRGQGSEFDSLREYVAGDDPRSIDWRATARRTSVVVRTYRAERDRRVILTLDTGRTSAGRVGDLPRLDHVLDAAQLLAILAVRAGDRVDLVAHDALPRAALRGRALGGAMLPRLVNTLSTIEPALVEADHVGLATAVLRMSTRRALVVLFTDLLPAVVEESLLPALPALTERHVVLLAALGDPRVAEMARERGSVRAAYEAAAAERTMQARRRLSTMLRHRGVEIVDAPPDQFASAVADRYLALKAAGRL